MSETLAGQVLKEQTPATGLHSPDAGVRALSPSFRSYSAATWTVARQSLSMGLSRQENWRGLPFPPPGHLPAPGTEPAPPASPALAGGFFSTQPAGKPSMWGGSTERPAGQRLPDQGLGAGPCFQPGT